MRSNIALTPTSRKAFVVFITLCAVMSSADSWVMVEQFGKAKKAWLTEQLGLENSIPSHDRFGDVFAQETIVEIDKGYGYMRSVYSKLWAWIKSDCSGWHSLHAELSQNNQPGIDQNPAVSPLQLLVFYGKKLLPWRQKLVDVMQEFEKLKA